VDFLRKSFNRLFDFMSEIKYSGWMATDPSPYHQQPYFYAPAPKWQDTLSTAPCTDDQKAQQTNTLTLVSTVE
jgi:hypothetical protein